MRMIELYRSNEAKGYEAAKRLNLRQHRDSSPRSIIYAESWCKSHIIPICQAPEAFMTDHSSAEKAALQATWPEGTQLLCQFHVAQAEWRWIMSNVEQDKRRTLMVAFQKVGR